MSRRHRIYRYPYKFRGCEIFIIAVSITVYFLNPGKVGLCGEMVYNKLPSLYLANMEDSIPLELHHLYSAI